MLKHLWISAVAVVSFGGVVRAADSVSPDSSRAIAPAVQEAISELSSDDFTARRKGLKHLEAAYAQEAVTLASVEDDQVQADLMTALEFHDALIRWVENVLKMPREERVAELNLLSDPKALPALSKIFSVTSAVRVEGIKALATLDLSSTPPVAVDVLLGHLIDDNDRAVSLAAMEVAWDRTPSKPVVNALWQRAVRTGMDQSLPVAQPMAGAQTLTFRGKPLADGLYFPGASTASFSKTDSDVAALVLDHMQSPLVAEKVSAFFQQAAQVCQRPNVTAGEIVSYSSLRPFGKNAYALLESYKPVEAIESLYALATCHVVQKHMYNKMVATNRTSAIAAFVILTKQQQKDYHFQLLDQGSHNGAVWVETTEKDEDADVTKLQQWWEKNSQAYVQPASAGNPQ